MRARVIRNDTMRPLYDRFAKRFARKFLGVWRTERDSNPRAFGANGFQDRRIKPLCHLSAVFRLYRALRLGPEAGLPLQQIEWASSERT